MLDLDSQLKDVRTVAVAGHVKPDGDCVGSCLATYNYIKNNYPQVDVDLYLEPIPNIFKFLSRSDEIIHDCADDKSYDIFIAQDCGDTGRLGKSAKYFETAKKTVCVDHHISNEGFADENYIFPHASSTSELIYELLDKGKLTKEIAECIYLGMVHDTGVFQYSSTSAKTMGIAGTLMEMGIDFSKIVDDTFYKKTYSQNRILGKALIDAKLYLDGKGIASKVTLEDMKAFDALPKHLEGIVNQLRVTKDVEVAVFLYETEDGSYKFSTRSNGRVNVAEIAIAHGGGGHCRAAGFSMTGEPDQMIEAIMQEIAQQL